MQPHARVSRARHGCRPSRRSSCSPSAAAQALGRDLVAAWRELDTAAAQRSLDDVLGDPEPDVAAAGLLPLLDVLPPERRHVAARMVETRLLALADGWHEGPGRLALRRLRARAITTRCR